MNQVGGSSWITPVPKFSDTEQGKDQIVSWAGQQKVLLLGSIHDLPATEERPKKQAKAADRNTSRQVQQTFNQVSIALKAHGNEMSTEDLMLVKNTCTEMADKARGKSKIGQWFWNLCNRSVVKQLKNIQAMTDTYSLLEKNPIKIAQFNIGMDVRDYESMLGAKHEEIRNYKMALNGGLPPQQFIKSALERAQLFSDVVTEKHIDDSLDSMPAHVQKQWAKDPSKKENIRSELLAIFQFPKGSLAQAVVDGQFIPQPELEWLRGDICGFLDAVINSVLLEKREASELLTAQLFLKDENRPDVFFIQEAVSKDRTFLKELEKNGYQIIASQDGNIDGAVVINTKRFTVESIEGASDDNQSPIVIARDNITQKRCLFTSAHISGFSYDTPKEQLKDATSYGDEQSEKLMNRVQEIEEQQKKKGKPLDAKMIGADVNADPEKWAPRYEIFKERGFQVNRTSEPTNVNFKDSDHQTRNIDAIFSSVVGQKNGGKAEVVRGMKFAEESNMSDHLGIRKVIRLTA